MTLGETIKDRRKDLYLTQKDLAEDTCAQSMLSKIERDELIPSKKILKQLASKLQVSLNELEENIHEDGDRQYIHDLKSIIRTHLEKREYESIAVMMKNLAHTHMKLDEEDDAFFQWVNASLYYYKTNDSKEAIKQFGEIKLEALSSDLSVEILNALGRIYYLDKKFNKAIEVFEKAITSMQGDISLQTKSKLLFNHALTLEEKDRNKEALEIVIQAIEFLVKNNSLFLLGDFYHTKGYLLRNFGELAEAKRSNELALSIFEIQNNIEFRTMTQLEIREIEEEIAVKVSE